MALVPRNSEANKRLGDRALPALLWLSQWNREGPRARPLVRVEGEKGGASLLPRVMKSRSVAVGWCQSTPSLQRPCTRRGTGRMQGSGCRRWCAAQEQQLGQLRAPGGGLPEHGQGIGQGQQPFVGAVGRELHGLFFVASR